MSTIIQILKANLAGKSITYFKGTNKRQNVKCAICAVDINADYDVTVVQSEISDICISKFLNRLTLSLKNGDSLVAHVYDELQISNP